jgi:hypothetical protein
LNSRRHTDEAIGLVGATLAAAREARFVAASRLPRARLRAVSLARYASDPEAPLKIVLCPAGKGVADDLEFLRTARRAALWPPPTAEVWSAIAGLRGSHDAPPSTAPPGSMRRGSALLLEGNVSLGRARRAVSSGAPRDWIVERIQRVRVGRSGLDELRRLGIRWAVLEPVDVIALAASPALVRARSRWEKYLPTDVAVWTLPRGSGSPASDSRSGSLRLRPVERRSGVRRRAR